MIALKEQENGHSYHEVVSEDLNVDNKAYFIEPIQEV